jgi:hypothetical protein
MDDPEPNRPEALKNQGRVDTAFAVAIAFAMLIGMVPAGTAMIVGTVAIWLAVRGHQMAEQAVPLDDAEQRELERLRFQSKRVRHLLEELEKTGEVPLRYDLARCRQLEMLEAIVRRART